MINMFDKLCGSTLYFEMVKLPHYFVNFYFILFFELDINGAHQNAYYLTNDPNVVFVTPLPNSVSQSNLNVNLFHLLQSSTFQ